MRYEPKKQWVQEINDTFLKVSGAVALNETINNKETQKGQNVSSLSVIRFNYPALSIIVIVDYCFISKSTR